MARVAPFFKSLASAILLLAMTAGCGGSTGDGFKGERGQVSGTVTLDGKPLEKGCQVIFMSATSGYTASGVVGDEGKYTLVYSGGAGLPVGEYLVQLTAPFVPDSTKPVDPTQMGNQLKLGAKKKPETSIDAGPFPTRYGSTNTSKLTWTVVPKANTADFKLEK